MRYLLMLLLCLVAFPALAKKSDAYYTDPQHPGRHYDCTQPGTIVAYENSDVLFLCGAIDRRVEKSFLKGNIVHWKVVNPEGLFVKTPVGMPLGPEKAAEVVLAQLQEPFYDSSEKKMVRFLGGMMLLDVATTAAGLGGGVCSEAGPIAGRVPGLSVVISGGYFFITRHYAKKTPRYFTTSKQAFPWVIGAEHGVAGINNIVKCVL